MKGLKLAFKHMNLSDVSTGFRAVAIYNKSTVS
jgi:hypothetical protein